MRIMRITRNLAVGVAGLLGAVTNGMSALAGTTGGLGELLHELGVARVAADLLVGVRVPGHGRDGLLDLDEASLVDRNVEGDPGQVESGATALADLADVLPFEVAAAALLGGIDLLEGATDVVVATSVVVFVLW